jgi:hypothetical protein
VRAALKAIHERLAIVELEAKLSGQIESGHKSVTVNVQTVSPEQALEYARDVIALFGPSTAPQQELPALIECESTLMEEPFNGFNARAFSSSHC